MSADKVAQVEKLLKEYHAAYQPKLVELYALIPTDSALAQEDAVNRIGGRPIGVDRRGWPRYARLRRLLEQDYRAQDKPFDGDTRMEHVFTLDLRQTPELRRRPGVPRDAVAMAFFISSRGYNEAWSSSNDETATIFLTEAHLAAGVYEGPMPARNQDEASRAFEVIPLQVPQDLFEARRDAPDAQGQALYALHRAIYNLPAYAGGQEIWLQGSPEDDDGGWDDGEWEGEDEEDEEDDQGDGLQGDSPEALSAFEAKAPAPVYAATAFLLQMSEAFADVNLGDSGELYVYGAGSFWQCY